ncbi:hypothetical protein [Cryptosporangium minutisporangium]|uniref:Resolvase/invertase-type recombinase catalytic domain-containing protein n=1 Tax=Cryptosporangium minutisporangium TaxID=113569 RepID=A0ABP6T2M9_9ACTN
MNSLARVVGYVHAAPATDVAPDLAALRTAASRLGIDLVSCYRASISDGPAPGAFGACLAAIERGDVDGVLVISWEQLAPNSLLARALSRHVWEAGGRLYVAADTADGDVGSQPTTTATRTRTVSLIAGRRR